MPFFYYGDVVCICEPTLGSFQIRDPDCRAGDEAHAIIYEHERGM